MGVISIYQVLKDGRSKKQEMGLYGSAIGLVSPELVHKTNCFRVSNGLERITLQASSYDDMMDWSTVIAQGISMETGGGVLLDKVKKESQSTLDTSALHQEPSIFRDVHNNEGAKSSIVFAKQIKELSSRDNPPAALVKSKSLDSYVSSTPLFEHLNTSRSFDVSEMETFKTLDPVDLSETMQSFANNFFSHAQDAFPNDNVKSNVVVPLQAARVQNLPCESIDSSNHSEYNIPWLEIDEATSAGSVALSDEEVVDKYLDLNASDTHLNAQDYAKILRYNESAERLKIEGSV